VTSQTKKWSGRTFIGARPAIMTIKIDIMDVHVVAIFACLTLSIRWACCFASLYHMISCLNTHKDRETHVIMLILLMYRQNY